MSLTGCRIALVGRRLEHNENLGLAYLRAALRAAGATVDTHYVNDPDELARAIGAILTAAPAVVGLSLADGGSSMLPLALGEALAEAGYAGHVTAGGQFATLSRDWLLERYRWLDSVVRFAGERPLVELAERVRNGQPVHGIGGVTTRDGDGAPAPVLDDRGAWLRPARDELPEILGHAAAHVAASRGCLGRCQYCGPASLFTLERQEGIRAGIASDELTRAGVGGVRRREIESVCDEMASLWHERGVRYFYFVDEHLLPYTEPEALEYLGLWKQGLAARRVGPLGIGTMLRADRITPAMIRAFVELGLVRVFVGLELATDEEGRRFGRRAAGPRELAVLDDFARAGVVTVSNLMLVNPYSTPATIAAGIDLLAAIPHGVFEATRMMVYHGTRLMKTMADERRLLGNPLRYGYTFEDPAVERFAEIFARLRAEAFWNYSIAFRTHDAFLALALAGRVCPERVTPDLVERIERVRRSVNRLYVAAYRQGLDLAQSGGGFVEAGSLVAAFRPRVAELEVELEAIERRLLEVAPRRTRPFAPMRSAAAGVVSFVVAACCGEPRRGPAEPPIAAPSGETTAPSSRTDAASPEVVIVAPSEAGATSEEPEDADAGAAPAPRMCSQAELTAADRTAGQLLARSASCFSGSIHLSDPPRAEHGITTGFTASSYVARLCKMTGADTQEAAAEAALAGKLPVCFDAAGRPVQLPVRGRASLQTDAVMKAIARCPVGYGTRVQVVLDAKGKVTNVTATPPSAAAKCIQRALAGLSFPCLASFEVCPEHVIIE